MKKLIISGATGYIGLNLVEKLLNEYDVYAFVRKTSNTKKLEKLLTAEKMILSDETDLYDRLENIKPYYFVHLAGKFAGRHDKDTLNDLIESNISAAARMLDAVYSAGCRNIINTGSYWQNYLGEENNPVDFYAATKSAFADIIRYYTKAKECRCVTLKLFDTYGPGDTRGKLLNLIKRLEDGQSIDVSPCTQKMFYCYIDDVVEAYGRALEYLVEKPPGYFGEYAVRGDKPIALKQIIEMFKEISGKNITINYGARPPREREINDPTGIGTILPGWECKVPLEVGLKKFSEYKMEVEL